MHRIFVDADACPVKDEVYRVARRCGLEVTLVSNSWMRVPRLDWLELVVVGDGVDEADDWIVEKAGTGDIVVTADILLASRSLKCGARAVSPRGRVFTEESIGDAVAITELKAELREFGEMTGGPPPFGKRDRSQFLQSLDAVVQSVRRDASSG